MSAQVLQPSQKIIDLVGRAGVSDRPVTAPSCIDCASHEHCLGARLMAGACGETDPVLRHHRTLRSREHVFRQGDTPEALYIVQSGSAKLYFNSEHGNEQVVAFYMPGEALGLDALGIDTYRSSALALERTSLCAIPYATLFQAAHGSHSLYQTLSRELVRDQHTIELIAKKDADAKMANFLINLSERFRARGFSARRFNLSMKRSEIGSHLGLAIETVSRILTRFQDEGLLFVQRRQVEILNFERLEKLAGVYEAKRRVSV